MITPEQLQVLYASNVLAFNANGIFKKRSNIQQMFHTIKKKAGVCGLSNLEMNPALFLPNDEFASAALLR